LSVPPFVATTMPANIGPSIKAAGRRQSSSTAAKATDRTIITPHCKPGPRPDSDTWSSRLLMRTPDRELRSCIA
jgi:hypothetical protein